MLHAAAFRKRMTSLQCLKHEWLCQLEKEEKNDVKNNQEDHSSSGKKDPELNATKHNLSQNKENWDPSHNYVMFDCETRTVSRAEPRDDEEDGGCENEEKLEEDDNGMIDHSSTENNEVNEVSGKHRISTSSLLVNSAMIDNNTSSDCRKRMAADGEEDKDYLDANTLQRKRSKTPLVEGDEGVAGTLRNISAITPLPAQIFPQHDTHFTVISYDQVQQKAKEIKETKRMSTVSADSFESCSIVMKSTRDHQNGDDIEMHADDEETATEDPTPTPDVSEISVPCGSCDFGEREKTPEISSAIQELSTSAMVIPLDHPNVRMSIAEHHDNQHTNTSLHGLPDHTLWQATERTITPLWETAHVGEIPPLGRLSFVIF